jgi:hypothetical protein
MKLTAILYAALVFSFTTVTAQTAAPAGFVKGSITLANGSNVTGFVKDNIKKSAAVVFIDDAGNKKTYEGSQINGITIDASNFICINGDFFKTICTGKLCFLQKASDASGNASYNGNEPIFNSGTEGKIGDYFAYTDKKLKLLNKKTVEAFINTDLSSCAAAVEKAKAINGDIAKLQEAVDIYNSSVK